MTREPREPESGVVGMVVSLDEGQVTSTPPRASGEGMTRLGGFVLTHPGPRMVTENH